MSLSSVTKNSYISPIRKFYRKYSEYSYVFYLLLFLAINSFLLILLNVFFFFFVLPEDIVFQLTFTVKDYLFILDVFGIMFQRRISCAMNQPCDEFS